MGILHRGFCNSFSRGLYNRYADKYRVYVDGEYIWHKGIIDDNINSNANPEQYIANTAYNFLYSLLKRVKLYFDNAEPAEVYVYMDGKRLNNKGYRARPTESNIDCRLVRNEFMMLCAGLKNCKVVALSEGEAELEMYLQRNRDSNLNVFITTDTDMYSICYGHTPKIVSPTSQQQTTSGNLDSEEIDYGNNEELDKVIDHNSSYIDNTLVNCKPNSNIFLDDNKYYKNPTLYKITDSCVWLRGNDIKNYVLVGFDFSQNTHKITPKVFRTFVAMCGTDYTKAIISDSMGINFFTSKKSKYDINHLNLEHDVLKLIVSILYYSICNATTSIRLPKFDLKKNNYCKVDDLILNVSNYANYINTGKMINTSNNLTDYNSNITKNILKSMINYSINDVLSIKVAKLWCSTNTVHDAISNVEKNLTAINKIPYNVILMKGNPIEQMLDKRALSDGDDEYIHKNKKVKLKLIKNANTNEKIIVQEEELQQNGDELLSVSLLTNDSIINESSTHTHPSTLSLSPSPPLSNDVVLDAMLYNSIFNKCSY